MKRRHLLASLFAVLLAPFVRLFERFLPNKPVGHLVQGAPQSVDLDKVCFDPKQPFSASVWLKIPNKRGAVPACTINFVEPHQWDDVEEQWHIFTVEKGKMAS
ncbi:MAG: hypothetical protein JRD89_02390 [Deltaproteobacteria bacterium]|nr:hypothetical protein [Deltaproteobacteria bacterium]